MSSSTSPQGPTASECPWVRRGGPSAAACSPHCAGASTKHPVSIARARSSTSQCAAPVAGENALGTVSTCAPARASAR